MRDLMMRLGVIGELFSFLWKRKLYWLVPMIVVLVLVGALIILSANPATSPFIYSLF